MLLLIEHLPEPGVTIGLAAIILSVVTALLPPVSDWLWIKSLRRRGADLKVVVDGGRKEREQEITRALAVLFEHENKISQHEDQIIAFEAAVKAQGLALNNSLSAALDRQTHEMEQTALRQEAAMNNLADRHERSLSEVTRTLERIQAEANNQATTLADLAGYIRAQPWNGKERRRPPG